MKEKDAESDRSGVLYRRNRGCGPVQSNKKATVMVKEGADGLLDVSVSDPAMGQRRHD